MKKIKSVKRNGKKYEYHFGRKAWQLYEYARRVEEIPEDIVLNCPLFEIEYEPERWRANFDCVYYHITSLFAIMDASDYGSQIDNDRYNRGNYFRTEEQAKKCLDFIKENINKFHENTD